MPLLLLLFRKRLDAELVAPRERLRRIGTQGRRLWSNMTPISADAPATAIVGASSISAATACFRGELVAPMCIYGS